MSYCAHFALTVRNHARPPSLSPSSCVSATNLHCECPWYLAMIVISRRRLWPESAAIFSKSGSVCERRQYLLTHSEISSDAVLSCRLTLKGRASRNMLPRLTLTLRFVSLAVVIALIELVGPQLWHSEDAISTRQLVWTTGLPLSNVSVDISISTWRKCPADFHIVVLHSLANGVVSDRR